MKGFQSITYIIFSVFIIFIPSLNSIAQEYTAPFLGNPKLQKADFKKPTIKKRTTPIELPLFENFHSTDTSVYPIDLWWIDSTVYINNHFTNNHRNKGIATFDVINQYGNPYASDNPFASLYCDSLTSYYINLSNHEIGDSIYLSFEYLSKGLGFQPKLQDSLLIFFNDSLNGWKRVGYLIPDTSSNWKTMMIPVTDANCFYENFQFRIINRGTIGNASSHWHLDNIYLGENRNINDTLLFDFAFSQSPSNLLNDFTSMPFKHFNTNRIGFSNDRLLAHIFNRNHLSISNSGSIYLSAKNAISNAILGNATSSFIIADMEKQSIEFPTYPLGSLTPDADGNLIIEHKYYFHPLGGDTFQQNDTIIQKQIFNRYFAYDDGSAEQSYFLNLAPSTPGKIAIEYATYVNDTLAGVDIQFAPQIPSSEYKEFYIEIYRNIEIGGSGGELLHREEGLFPILASSANGFQTYPLSTPLPLGIGTYYISITMPASGISDSLMIGLDRNRIGGNHRYYNVLNVWESSLLEGALMIRPIMGGNNITNIPKETEITNLITLYPNPAKDYIQLNISKIQAFKQINYRIINLNGSIIHKGVLNKNNTIGIENLPQGSFNLQVNVDDLPPAFLPFIKL